MFKKKMWGPLITQSSPFSTNLQRESLKGSLFQKEASNTIDFYESRQVKASREVNFLCRLTEINIIFPIKLLLK
jgi:hypothetical protein